MAGAPSHRHRQGLREDSPQVLGLDFPYRWPTTKEMAMGFLGPSTVETRSRCICYGQREFAALFNFQLALAVRTGYQIWAPYHSSLTCCSRSHLYKAGCSGTVSREVERWSTTKRVSRRSLRSARYVRYRHICTHPFSSSFKYSSDCDEK